MDPVPEDGETLARLDAEVCACASGANIGIDAFAALMGREWHEDDNDCAALPASERASPAAPSML